MMIEEVKLTEKQLADLASCGWGEDWVKRRTYFLKCKGYVELFLNQEKLYRGTPFNCYHVGRDRFWRKDGTPITEEDIRAIQGCGGGQGSKIQWGAGNLEVIHEWFTDSSD